MKNVAIIKQQITVQENKLRALQRSRAVCQENLSELESAKAELKQIMKQYDLVFKAASSYPNMILAMDSLGLVGVEKIQSMISNAYRGTREKSFLNNVASMLTALQKKILSEEYKIKSCQQNISNTKNAITSLERELTSAI